LRLGDGDLLWCRTGAHLVVCRLGLGQVGLGLSDVGLRACAVEPEQQLACGDLIALGDAYHGHDTACRQAEQRVLQRHNLAFGHQWLALSR